MRVGGAHVMRPMRTLPARSAARTSVRLCSLASHETASKFVGERDVDDVGERPQAVELSFVDGRCGGSPRSRCRLDFHHDAFASFNGALEFIARALSQRAPMVHDHDAVADLLDLFHIVARIYHGRALVAQALDAGENGVAALRVHGHRGLVEEDKLRFVGDTADDVEAAQQAARELAGAKAAELLEPHELDCLVHERTAPCAVVHVERAEVIDVLADGELVDDGDLLRHDADAALEVVARGAHGFAEQLNGAAVIREKGEHAVDAGGLARAIGTQQAKDLAPGYV